MMSSKSYYDPFAGFAVAGVAFLVLSIIGLIAGIVLTVIAYKKYVSPVSRPLFKVNDQSTWGPFFRFETLAIDKILKALYLYTAISGLITYVVVVISSLFSGNAGLFFAALIIGALVTLLYQVIVRLWFEQSMLLVLVTENTNDIRTKVCGIPPVAPIAPAPAPTPAPAPVAPEVPVNAAPVAVAPVAAVVTEAPASGSEPTTTMGPVAETWTCPSCGESSNAGNFCKSCGKPRP